jgi:hypothetical protein
LQIFMAANQTIKNESCKLFYYLVTLPRLLWPSDSASFKTIGKITY